MFSFYKSTIILFILLQYTFSKLICSDENLLCSASRVSHNSNQVLMNRGSNTSDRRNIISKVGKKTLINKTPTFFPCLGPLYTELWLSYALYGQHNLLRCGWNATNLLYWCCNTRIPSVVLFSIWAPVPSLCWLVNAHPGTTLLNCIRIRLWASFLSHSLV